MLEDIDNITVDNNNQKDINDIYYCDHKVR